MNTLATHRRILRRTRLAAVCLLMACAIAASLSPQPAAAQAPQRSESAEQTIDVEQLRSRAAALRAELERERKRVADAKSRSAEELKELQQERSAAADRLLALELERERNAEKLKSLQADSSKTAEDAKSLVSEANAVVDAAREAAEQLRLHLREVPASDAATEELRAIAATLTAPGNNVTPEKRAEQAAAIETLLAKCDAAHAAASSVRAATASVYTATGDREEVKLLSIGHVRFAYQTVSGGRIGIALTSDQEASGYRWTEDLPAETQDAIRQAIQACESGAGGLAAIPLDPTGKLRPEGMNTEQTATDWFLAGGLAMFPLAAVGLAALIISLERVWYLYLRNPSADAIAHDVLAACAKGDFARAEAACADRRGAASRVMAACLARRTSGQRAMEDAIQEQLLHELPMLHRFTSSLATFANVAPLLGLLGTVAGIIRTFSVITSFGNANPVLMAGGISEALIATAFGLIVAVPVVIAHSLLRSRSERVLADAERHGASLLTALVHQPGVGSAKGAAIIDAATPDERPRPNGRAVKPSANEAIKSTPAAAIVIAEEAALD